MNLMSVNGVALEIVHLPAAGSAPVLRAPLIFLHEGLGSVAMWRDWPARLCAATGRAGIVYSRRGYGRSEPVTDVRGQGRLAPDYLHREAFEVLPALIVQLALTAAPVLVGHSDGGSIGLLYASRYPVTACIAMAPHVMVEEVSVRAIAQAREAFVSGDLRERLARYHDDVDGAFWQWNDVWLSDGFRSFDIRQECRHIAAPVLAIQGNDDPYGTMAQIDEIEPAPGHITRCKLVDCGHSPHRDQQEHATQAMVGFLAGLP